MSASFPHCLQGSVIIATVLAGVSAGILPASRAFAEPIEDAAELRWAAPNACPRRARFGQKFRELRSGAPRLPPASSVEIVANAGRFELRLEWRSDGGLQRRRFLARDCALLIDLAAITLAIESASVPTMPSVSASSPWAELAAVDLDPDLPGVGSVPTPPKDTSETTAAIETTEQDEAALEPEPQPERFELAPQPKKLDIARRAGRRPRSSKRAPPQLRRGLQGVVTMQAGFLDVPSRARPLGPGGGLGVGLDWRAHAMKMGVAMEYWLPAVSRWLSGEVRVQAFALPLAVCFQPRLGRLELAICGLGKVSGFWARALAIEGALARGRFGVMGSAGIETALLLPLSSGFALSVGLAVWVNWARPQFGLRAARNASVYQPGLVGARAFLRLHFAVVGRRSRKTRGQNQ